MSIYDWYLAGAALFVAAIAAGLQLRRALLWIASLAADFALSLGYMYMPKLEGPGIWWPPASGVNMMLDATICIMIYTFGKRRWETVYLYALMLISVSVNLLYTTGEVLGFPPVPPHETYAIILEVINYLALLLIFGTAILNRLGDRGHITASGIMGAFHLARETVFTRHRPSEALRKQSR